MLGCHAGYDRPTDRPIGGARFVVVRARRGGACYVSLRTGWSQRWRDPALTMPQMVYSLVVLMLAYGINPQ